MLFHNRYFRDLERLQRSMDSLLSRSGFVSGGYTFPAINLYENSDAVIAEIVIPGMAKEEVTISFENGSLLINGERKGSEKTAKMTSVRRERKVGAFKRSIDVPVEVDVAKISATMDNGVLSITMPKTEAAKPKQIAIH